VLGHLQRVFTDPLADCLRKREFVVDPKYRDRSIFLMEGSCGLLDVGTSTPDSLISLLSLVPFLSLLNSDLNIPLFSDSGSTRGGRGLRAGFRLPLCLSVVLNKMVLWSGWSVWFVVERGTRGGISPPCVFCGGLRLSSPLSFPIRRHSVVSSRVGLFVASPAQLDPTLM
jgi:hypothetical protein